MNWKIDFSEPAQKQLRKLDYASKGRIIDYLKTRIIDYLKTRINVSENPRRFGDYRLICEIRDHELLVLVLKVGHRRDVYD